VGDSVAIPSHSSVSGTGSLTGWSEGSVRTTASGRITLRSSTSNCYYAQIKMVGRWGTVDGDWKKKGSTYCGAGTVSIGWSDTFVLGYGGVKFRICRDVSWGLDTCGAASAIINR
jgi:hypothetical protein